MDMGINPKKKSKFALPKVLQSPSQNVGLDYYRNRWAIITIRSSIYEPTQTHFSTMIEV